MSTRTPLHAAPEPAAVSEHDARVLAGLLRSAPLTVLLSPPGLDTTPLLLHGVMPKLRRRATDRAPEAAASATVLPFVDRRAAVPGAPARREREVAVFFDAWNDDPVAALLRQLHQAVDLPGLPPLDDRATLAGAMADLQARHGLRFLLLLDRFEDALWQRTESALVAEFIRQWLEVVARPGLGAHFLVALPEADLGRFDGVRERIASFEDRVLRANGEGRLFGLSSVSLEVPPDVLAAVASTHAAAPEVDDDTFLASLSDISARVAASAKEPAVEAPAIELPPFGEPPPPEASNDEPWSPPPAVPQAAKGAASPPLLRAPSYAWLLVPVLVGAAWWWFDRDEAPAPRIVPAQAPAPAPAVAQAPLEAPPEPTAAPPATAAVTPIDIAVDASNGTDQRIARDLAVALAPAGGIELPAIPARGGLGTLSDLAAASTSPRLAIVNADALQAAQALQPRPPLATVAPLYLQEIYLVVRVDSPLRFLHDLRGARIDAGPQGGSRSLTTQALFQRLFGQPLPAEASTTHSEDEALAELLAFRSIDVVATVGGQPLPWLANLPKASRDRIRLLRVDARHPIDRRALQAYAPSTVRDLALGGGPAVDVPTVAVRSFLVTNARPDDPAAAARLTGFAKDFCQALPALRQAGHPKWAEVHPTRVVPTGFEYSAAAQAGFSECREAAAPPPAAKPARAPHRGKPTPRRHGRPPA